MYLPPLTGTMKSLHLPLKRDTWLPINRVRVILCSCVMCTFQTGRYFVGRGCCEIVASVASTYEPYSEPLGSRCVSRDDLLVIPGYLGRESCCLGNDFSAGLRLGTLGISSVPTCVEGREPQRHEPKGIWVGKVTCVSVGKGQPAFPCNSSLACKGWRPTVCCSLGLGMSEGREDWSVCWLVPDTENPQTPILGMLY